MSDLPHSSLQSFVEYVDSPEALSHADAWLEVSSKKFKCHRLMLAIHSPLLRAAMLASPTDTEECHIILAEENAETVESLLRFMYSGQVTGDDFSPPEWMAPVSETGEKINEVEATATTGVATPRSRSTKRRSRQSDKEAWRRLKGNHQVAIETRYLICCEQKLSSDSYREHLASDHRFDESTEQAFCCEDNFTGMEDLTRHCSSMHGLVLSRFQSLLCCTVELNSLEDFARHKAESDHFECPRCAFLSKDEENMQKHLSEMHASSDDHVGQKVTFDDTLVQSSQSAAFQHQCETCEKCFKMISSSQSLVYRVSSRRTSKTAHCKNDCDSCDRATGARQVKRSKKDHGDTSKNHECSECDAVFANQRKLDRHVKVAHLKVKDIQCTSCGKLFATQERMRVHEKFVHVVEEKKVPCDVCGKEFVNR